VILPNRPPAQPQSGCFPDHPSVLDPKLGSANGGNSSSPRPGRRGAGRGVAHAVAHPPEDFRQRGDVLALEGIEEHPPGDPDMARHYARDQLSSGRRDRDCGAALVVLGGFARDQPGLLQPTGLVGEPAAAVNHPVGEVGHALPARRRVGEPGQDLELHVAEPALVAQLPLDGVAEQAAHLHEGEVGGELLGVETLRFAHINDCT
jgi:hypothetical protein